MKNVMWGLGILAGGIAVCAFAYFQISKARASASWPTVEGKVSASSVEKRTERRRSGSDSRRTKILYYPRVTYTYDVDGTSHTGSRINYAPHGYNTRSGAQDVVADYPVGAAPAVHYNPEDPGESVLEPGGSWRIYLIAPVGGFLVIIGLLVLLGIAKPAKRPGEVQTAVTS